MKIVFIFLLLAAVFALYLYVFKGKTDRSLIHTFARKAFVPLIMSGAVVAFFVVYALNA